MKYLAWLLGLALIGGAPAQTPDKGPTGASVPGLTVWAWDLDGELKQMPTVAPGQTPNFYKVLPTLDMTSLEGLDKTFAGRAFGWLHVTVEGRYRFRLTCDDGAKLTLGGREIVDSDNSEATALVELAPGYYPVEIPFYQNGGKFALKLEWQRSGESGFTVVPAENLLADAGQTYVTSPGIKRWFIGKDPRAPGDGRPLQGVHPSYTLETIRPPYFTPAVGGMCFLPDGRLAVCTWDQVGAVYILSSLNGKPKDVKVTTFAEGLGEPLGIAYVSGDIYVTQKREITRLRDTDHDGIADSFEAIAEGWPASHNYHEFSFNLVPYHDKFYISTSVPLRGGWTYYNPGSEQGYPLPGGAGSILEVDPKTGTWKVFANGLRTPNGMGIGVDGQLFVCDNQGSWLPSSRINWVRPGGFYGHQMSPDGTHPMDPPVAWLPHGEISNSPSEPVLIKSGPYKGQMLFGDVTYGGVQRLFVEKVDGQYQAAVFRFTQGIEAGVNRLAWGPDGALYLGGIGSNGNWNHENTRYGLQRLVPNGKPCFEMKSVHALSDGFTVTFTAPVAHFDALEMDRFHYEPKEFYGGPKVDIEKLKPVVLWSADRLTATVHVPMTAGEVYHFRWVGARAVPKETLWSTETWYTLNRVPGGKK